MNFTRYILLFSLWLSSSAQSSTRGWFTGKAIRSSIAANAVGVNTHLNYLGSVYDLHYSDIIKPRLAELGVRHIRDHFGNQIVNNRYVELAHQYGIKLLMICADNGEGLAKARDEVVRLNQIDPIRNSWSERIKFIIGIITNITIVLMTIELLTPFNKL